MGWLACARGVGAAPGEARLGQPRGRTGLFSSFHGRLADLPRPAEVRASAGPASDGTSDPRSLLTRSWQGATPCQPGGPSPQPTWGRAPLQGRHHRRPPRGARERGAVLPGSRVRAVGHDRGQPLGAGLLQERLPPLSAPGALRPGVSVRGACRRQPGASPPGTPNTAVPGHRPREVPSSVSLPGAHNEDRSRRSAPLLPSKRSLLPSAPFICRTAPSNSGRRGPAPRGTGCPGSCSSLSVCSPS